MLHRGEIFLPMTSIHEHFTHGWVETSSQSFPRFKDVSLADTTIEHVNIGQNGLAMSIGNLFRIVLLDLVKPQKSVFARELILQ